MRIRWLLLVPALLLSFNGCHGGKTAKAPAVPAQERVEAEAAEPPREDAAVVAPGPGEKTAMTETAGSPAPGTVSEPPAPPREEKAQAPEPATAQESAEPLGLSQASKTKSPAPESAPPDLSSVADTVESTQARAEAAGEETNGSGPYAASRRAKKLSEADPADVPEWARGKEELVYRVEFLGMTMGYARFTFKGKVSWNGKQTYHLSVRAWTSDVLSVIYPINDTIDYYLDVKTLAPLRQEYTGGVKGKEDVATFDQENGKIVYRYRKTGEIRKKVDAPPNVYDPVTAAYYFRARDFGAAELPRNVYAGRKLWQISPRLLGHEKIDTATGPVETVVIQPILMRDGKLESKGEFKMWVTNDARHVPVRIYAKFKKIRMWTLLAELVPAREGG